eukprot:3357548-Pleurochrysis_carterae.AAC.1
MNESVLTVIATHSTACEAADPRARVVHISVACWYIPFSHALDRKCAQDGAMLANNPAFIAYQELYLKNFSAFCVLNLFSVWESHAQLLRLLAPSTKPVGVSTKLLAASTKLDADTDEARACACH